MKKLWIILVLIGLLSSETETLKVSEKDYENIDQMLEFGVQVFLNYLDKVKEVTEKLVKEDMLKTNRIAIQNHWNSFKETANKINTEERDKGVQDDLIIAARTVRRLIMYYKDDVKQIFHSLATGQNVQLYQPVGTMFKGIIEKAKVKEVWGNMVSNYLPEAPPIENEPLEFLCYMLSTAAVERVFVNVIKVGVDVASEINKIDFTKVKERLKAFVEKVGEKFNEIEKIEKQKEKDGFPLIISVTYRVAIFYLDEFLNSTDTPLLKENYDKIRRKLEDIRLRESVEELLRPIMESETMNDLLRLHFDFYREFYDVGLVSVIIVYFVDPQRFERTLRTLFMTAVVHSHPIYEKLCEMGVFSGMKNLYFRTVDIVIALIGEENVKSFREVSFEKWKSFRKELNTLVDEERSNPHTLIPQVRGILRFLKDKFMAFVDRVNTEIDDDRANRLIEYWTNVRTICSKKLVASGALTQEQLDKTNRIFKVELMELVGKIPFQELGQKRSEDIFMAMTKVLLVGFNFIYAPLTQAWDFISI